MEQNDIQKTCQKKVMCSLCGRQICCPSTSMNEKGVCKVFGHYMFDDLVMCAACFFQNVRERERIDKKFENDFICR